MKNKIVRKRHRFYKLILMPIIKLVLRVRYCVSAQKVKIERNTNYLILSNFVGALDPLCISASFKAPIYFIANDSIFDKILFSGLIKRISSPIIKKKTRLNIETIKKTLKVVNEGGNVGIFVEGKRTFDGKFGDINKKIIKLIKKVNKPLILYNITGSYGANPRWGIGYRRGKVFGKVKKVISVEELNQMTDEQIHSTIVNGLTVDDFTTQYRYKSSRKAEKLERVLYLCPICLKNDSLKSNKNILYCNECGLKVKYNEDLTFSSEEKNFVFKNVPEWYQYQKEQIEKTEIPNTEKLIYSDKNVSLIKYIDNKKITVMENSTLIMTNKSLLFLNDKKKIDFRVSLIDDMYMQMGTRVFFFSEGYLYKYDAGLDFNGIKYVDMFNLLASKR